MDFAVFGEGGLGFGVVVDAGVEVLIFGCGFCEAYADVDGEGSGFLKERGCLRGCRYVAVFEEVGEFCF